jgi:peptidoglycan/LPS O-acetylase OafA/YrhL
MAETKFNKNVHGFRGLAVVSVFIFHLFSALVLQDLLPTLPWGGLSLAFSSLRYGVELFFMVSGYVILGSLRRHHTIGQFLIDRVLRIYPAFLPILLLIFFIGPLFGRGVVNIHINGWDFFKNITLGNYILIFFENLFFLPTIFRVPLAHWAAWSLSYEWLFYVIISSLFFYVGKKILTNWVAIIILSLSILTFVNFYPRGAFFLPGVFVFFFEERIRRLSSYFNYPALALIIVFASWSATGVNDAGARSQLLPWCHDFRCVYAIIALVSAFYLFSCIVMGRGILSWFLASRIFKFFGTISYSFYLWSPIAIIVVRHLVVPYFRLHFSPSCVALLYIVSSSIGSVVAAWVSWRLLEINFARYLKQMLRLAKKVPT